MHGNLGTPDKQLVCKALCEHLGITKDNVNHSPRILQVDMQVLTDIVHGMHADPGKLTFRGPLWEDVDKNTDMPTGKINVDRIGIYELARGKANTPAR